MANEAGKRAAAEAAARLVVDGMTVGLGTGTTAAFFVAALAVRMRSETLRIVGVPTSLASEALARSGGIPIVPLSAQAAPDLTIDGADEIGPGLALIKGGGGALVREKLVAASSKQMVVIADRSKIEGIFGTFPLPVAIFPYGWETTFARVASTFPETIAVLRETSGEPYLTDDGLFILDMRFGGIEDPVALEAQLKGIVGVADVGLFVGIATRAILGADDGSLETLLL